MIVVTRPAYVILGNQTDSYLFIYIYLLDNIYLQVISFFSGGYQPQPHPYQPPPPGVHHVGATTTIISPPGPIIMNMAFGESPVSMVCPHCQTHIITCTTYQDGTLTWLSAGALCLLG